MNIAEIIQILVAPVCVAAMTFVIPKMVSKDKHPAFDEIKNKLDSFIEVTNERTKESLADRERLHCKLNRLLANDERQDGDIKDFGSDLLKMQVWSESLDLEDRFIAAVKYFKRGGNGQTKELIYRLINESNENKLMWDVVCRTLKFDLKGDGADK
jgi:hypothetical protein